MPSDEMLQLGLSSSTKLNDDAGTSHWLELLVTYHPKPEYWQNLLAGMFNAKLNDTQLLQVYRLSADVGALKRGSDYAEMAQVGVGRRFGGRSRRGAVQGLCEQCVYGAGGQEPQSAPAGLSEEGGGGGRISRACPRPRPTPPMRPTGQKLVEVGIANYGYGDYAKASKNLAAGLVKGSTKDAQDARLLLGVAQFKAGAKDDAMKSFKQVKGDPTMERLASLWRSYVSGAVPDGVTRAVSPAPGRFQTGRPPDRSPPPRIWRLGVLVDGDDGAGILDAGQMLDGP